MHGDGLVELGAGLLDGKHGEVLAEAALAQFGRPLAGLARLAVVAEAAKSVVYSAWRVRRGR
jgi:hypothetical protein